jgi:hypothetical protein
MKKLMMITGLLLSVLASLAFGQNFTYTATVTELQGSIGLTTSFHSDIHNLESTPVSFLVIMDRALLPPFPDWTATYCVDTVCYSPFTDTIEFIAPANGLDTVGAYITPGDHTNDGWATMNIQPVGHPELNQAIIFHVWQFNGVEEIGGSPQDFQLLQTYPNPFNAMLTLGFKVDHPAESNLAIYDLNGARVAQIFQGSAAMGEHRFSWNPGNLASGIYLAKLSMGGTEQVQKVVYLR